MMSVSILFSEKNWVDFIELSWDDSLVKENLQPVIAHR